MDDRYREAELDHLALAWRNRMRHVVARRRELARAARADAERIARMLVRRFGAKRVYLFGSLLVPDGFREASDIDLAAEGIPAERFIWASADAARATAFPLDLVPLEDCRASLREVVLREGVLLAGAGVPEKEGGGR